jgi:serine kinase of HPr protein (carbohydrate metabolism regulator)
MEQALIQNARDYASQHQLHLAERLGFGVHGIIFVAGDNSKVGKTAVKAHRSPEAYRRERAAYERLRAARVSEILGFHVPQLIRFNDELRVIEMSIVARPFVLDFAGAYLDAPPEFPEEKWAEWEAEKREQFEARWPKVRAVLAALEALDIYMVDVSPSNIAFAG